jgi:hypothetical protein
MAFGGLKGTLTNSAGSITNPFSATGSVSVSVGDLVVALLAQQTNLTISAVTDNLGHTYTDQNAGSDAGATTMRMFYVRVTTAGTLTSIDATCTASTNNVTFPCAVFEGPFAAPPIDANIANAVNTDVTSPFTCPSTGTLSQASELVIALMTRNSTGAILATSPNLLAINETGQVPPSAIGYQVVSATTAVAPEFTCPSGDPTQSILGTCSFKEGSSNKTLAIDAGSYSVTGQAVTLSHGFFIAVDSGSYGVTGQDVTLTHGFNLAVDAGSYAVTGQDVSLTKTWLLNVDVSSYAITGQDVALQKGLTLGVDAGSYSVTGQDVTLVHDFAIPVDAGSYAISGQDVALTHAWSVSVDAGSYSINGQDVTLTLTTAGAGGHVFQCNVFQNNVFQGVCSVTPEPTPTPEAGGAGRVVGVRGGSTGPAFPRRTRDLYRTYEPPPAPTVEAEPAPEAPKPEPVKLGELSATVLPQMMGLTVVHGQAEIDALAAQKRLQQQLMMEDEEAAIIAILAASIH